MEKTQFFSLVIVEVVLKIDKTRNKKLIFKNNAPFRSCISKINNTFIDNEEDLDTVIPMCNLLDLLEYSDNDSMTSENLQNYSRDAVNGDQNENNNANNRINNNKKITSKCFQYMKKIIGRTPINNNTLDAEVIVLLK